MLTWSTFSTPFGDGFFLLDGDRLARVQLPPVDAARCGALAAEAGVPEFA